jgi:hypothetical protein
LSLIPGAPCCGAEHAGSRVMWHCH